MAAYYVGTAVCLWACHWCSLRVYCIYCILYTRIATYLSKHLLWAWDPCWYITPLSGHPR